MHRQLWIFAVLVTALAGCGDGGSVHGERTTPEEHVWQDQVDTLDTARGVEKTLQDAAQARETRSR